MDKRHSPRGLGDFPQEAKTRKQAMMPGVCRILGGSSLVPKEKCPNTSALRETAGAKSVWSEAYRRKGEGRGHVPQGEEPRSGKEHGKLREHKLSGNSEGQQEGKGAPKCPPKQSV